MNKYGLIGFPLSHSFSKKYFTEKFEKENIQNSEYLNFELKSIDDFPELLNNNTDLYGFNVTIPYKEAIVPFLDELDATAEEIAAVNTVKVIRSKNTVKTIGYNTDVYGFKQSLVPYLEFDHKSALILGSGGAAKAVKYVLDELQITHETISRSGNLNYNNLSRNLIKSHTIIINTTPLGMYPNIDDFPKIPYTAISGNHILFDLIYNPTETLFMSKGKENGATIINGLKMLELQAEKAWMYFAK